MLYNLLTFNIALFFTALIFIILVCQIQFYRPIAAFFTMITYATLLTLFSNYNIFSIFTYPKVYYFWIPMYVLTGIIWSIFKWYLLVKQNSIKYNELKKQFCKRQNLLQTFTTNEDKKRWKEYLRQAPWMKVTKPEPSKYKGRIITWMAYWPLSAFWFIVGKPWQHIYNMLSNIYGKISDLVYEKVGFDEDMKDE